MEIEARRIRGDQYREGYAGFFEGKRVGDGDNAKHMWEQVKWGMVESTREVCNSVRVEEKNSECVVEQ